MLSTVCVNTLLAFNLGDNDTIILNNKKERTKKRKRKRTGVKKRLQFRYPHSYEDGVIRTRNRKAQLIHLEFSVLLQCNTLIKEIRKRTKH